MRDGSARSFARAIAATETPVRAARWETVSPLRTVWCCSCALALLALATEAAARARVTPVPVTTLIRPVSCCVMAILV